MKLSDIAVDIVRLVEDNAPWEGHRGEIPSKCEQVETILKQLVSSDVRVLAEIERLREREYLAYRDGQEEMRDRIAENLLAEWDRYPDTIQGQLRASITKIVRALPIGGQDD